jgi:hypothetical protein
VQTDALDDYSSDSGGYEFTAYTNLYTTAYSDLVVSFPAWQSNLAAIGTLTEYSAQTKRQTQDTSNGYAHAFGDKIIPNISNVVSSWKTENLANWTITQASFKRIAAVAGAGLTYLACGKWGFNDNDDGFIFGREAGTTKIIIGNQEEHLSIIGGVVENTLKFSRYTAINASVPLLLSGGVFNSTNSTSYTKIKELKIGRRGDYELRWNLKNSTESPNYVYGQLRVNRFTGMGVGAPAYAGEEVITTITVNTPGGTRSMVSVLTDLNPYDLISIYAKCDIAPGEGQGANGGNFDLYVDNSDEYFVSSYTLQA